MVAQAQFRRAGDITLPREDRVVVHRLETETTNVPDALVEFVAVERTGRRDDGEAIARSQGARLQHARTTATKARTHENEQ